MGTLARNGLITLLLNNQVTKVYLAFSMIFKPSLTILHNCHCVKSVQIRSNVWSVFSRIRIEYGRYFVSLHIQSECGKIRTRNYFVFGSSRLQIFFKIAVLRNVAGNSVLFKTCSKKFDRDFSHERVKQIEDTLLILKMKPS